MAALLELEDVAVARGGEVVVSGVSLTLDAGEGLQLLGPNGSGKTTLLRVVAGFLRPERGAIHMPKMPSDRERHECLHYVGHDNGLKSTMTVAENAAFWLHYYGYESGTDPFAAGRARLGGGIEDVLHWFGLGTLLDIPAGYLSAGQQRRLGLTRLALIPRPLWLLDEPSVSLDTEGQELLATLVNRHLEAGGAAIAATHVPLGMALRKTLKLTSWAATERGDHEGYGGSAKSTETGAEDWI